jgi:drug/metabolite transporter (DMT)-like permease
VTEPHPAAAPSRLSDFVPGIITALSFAVGDVFSKVVLTTGGDVLSLAMFRSVFSVVVIFVWLRMVPPPVPHTRRQRLISFGVGALFAGIVFGLFKSVELAQVPVAVLSYFVYPLITGIIGTLLGIDKLTWRGATAAIVAFIGLALIVGAQPGSMALAGIGFAVGAACCRTATLLVTRALLHDADTRLITWYTMLSSTSIFVAWSLVTWHWQGPQTSYGWLALIIVSVVVTIAVITLFMSIRRVGPFRTALVMNLEPLGASILSAPLLGEVITPLQGLGGVILLGALVAFQLRR